jgi:MtN3 and saliva related transmembrane protein
VGWCGVVVSTLTNFAQAARVRRIGPDGVNATTWSLFTFMSLFWLGYGLSVRSIEIVVSSIAGLPCLVLLLAMLPSSVRWRGVVWGAASLGVMACVPAALFGWDVGLLGLGTLIVATRVPQLVQLVRATHADGVSTGSWLLGSLNVSLWLVYYVSTSRSAAAISMGSALVTNLLIVALVLVRHRVPHDVAVVATEVPALTA